MLEWWNVKMLTPCVGAYKPYFKHVNMSTLATRWNVAMSDLPPVWRSPHAIYSLFHHFHIYNKINNWNKDSLPMCRSPQAIHSTCQHSSTSTFNIVIIPTCQHPNCFNIWTFQHFNISTFQQFGISTCQYCNISACSICWNVEVLKC